MSGRDVRFDVVELGRVLGISRGEGFTIRDFAPGVNLVHGPNGSGKSTTARVIQELLWPGRTDLDRPSVSGTFYEGSAKWSVAIEAGSVLETARDGKGGVTPDFGPAEERQRYHLALHDLIVADDQEFAREIQQASQGGFDLDAVADACGFAAKPSKPQGKASACAQAKTAVAEAKRKEADLDASVRQLDRLARERDAVDEAAAEMALLKQARELRELDGKCRELEVRLAALPDVLARMQGDERTRLDDLDAREAELAKRLAESRERVARSDAEIEALGLPPADVEPSVLGSLHAKRRRLADVNAEILRARSDLEAALAAASAAANRLGATLNEEQRGQLNAVEIPGLVEFTRQIARVQAARDSLVERRRWLDAKPGEALGEHDAEKLREGMTALAQWLAVPGGEAPPAPARSWLRVAAAVLIAIGFVVAGALFHVAFYVGVLLALVAAFEDLRGPDSAGGSDAGKARGVHRKSFEQTSLPIPTSWTPEVVAEHVRSLTRTLGARALEDERQRRCDDLVPAEEALRARETALADEAKTVQERLGLEVALDVQWLPTLVENLVAWQEKTTAAEVARASLEMLAREERQLLEESEAALRPWTSASLDGAEALGAVLVDLEARQAQRRERTTQREEAQRSIDGVLTPARAKVVEEKQVFFRNLELTAADAHRLDGWLAELGRYRALAQELRNANAVCESQAVALVGREDLAGMSLSDVERRITDSEGLVAQRDELIEEIARITDRVEAAKNGFLLADAASRLAQARVELADEKEAGDAAVVGAALVDWVRSVAIETTRPQVFRRANELFVSFTKGALRLDLDDTSSPPRFLARRGDQPGRPVEELSVGERVQLLMAVRIAFLEQNETARLPLLMDEILGTSDDERAAAIIDTVVEIARGGRQVFYFTAQHDEVGKWIARLTQEHIEHRVIDLAEIRHLSAGSRLPLQIAPVTTSRPPAPNGRDHRAYGDLLGVPSLDPSADHLDKLHLWHVVEDVGLLHRLLEKGISTWGQLRTLRDHGGLVMLALDETQRARIRATERVVEGACRAWREGRGRPVDRDALLDAACVSDAFIDAVADLARRLQGDALKLLAALGNREVARWRGATTEELRAYFEEAGYLTDRDPLSLDEVRIRTLAAVADALRDGVIEQATVDRIVGSLPSS